MSYIGQPVSRVDGRAKVTGAAKYAAEYTAPDLAYGFVVSGTVARGHITALDIREAEAVPGVLRIFTHENRPREAWFSRSYRDEDAPPGTPFRPLYSSEIQYSGQPIALVVAETYETARYAASLVHAEYDTAPHATDLDAERSKARAPKGNRTGYKPPAKPRGDVAAAFEAAASRVEAEYTLAFEHHNPMEPHASTVVWEGDGKITVYDKSQGAQNSHDYVCSVFGLSKDNVRVVNAYVGGAFGSGLRPQYQLFLAVMASTELKRSVRVELRRQQMFSFGYRPSTIQTVGIGADADGALTAFTHDAVANTSRFEDYIETVVNWAGLLYKCDNTRFGHELVELDLYTPLDMRAPGAVTGMIAIECAMDELAYKAGVDPLELRLRNYSDIDQNDNKSYTSKALREAYKQGAERFGWSKRSMAPGSMREGGELIGWGMATGIWEALHMKASARAVLTLGEGGAPHLEVASATADIGTGTYTVMALLAADALGLPIEAVTARLGDSTLPPAPLEGGSWTAASVGSAVQAACMTVRKQLFARARALDGSPLANVDIERVTFTDGEIRLTSDPSQVVSIARVLRDGGEDNITAEEAVGPGMISNYRFARNTHSAIFAEVRVDEELNVVRVTRIVNAVAAGRILNLKTARSQILGGVVWGMGMALEEETMPDHALGRFMNHSLAEYHIPVNADVHDIDVIFVDETDDEVNPLGVKGLGEIGIVGTAAAIVNAIFHATGKRVRDLPVTIDKLLD